MKKSKKYTRKNNQSLTSPIHPHPTYQRRMGRSMVHSTRPKRFIPMIRWNAAKSVRTESTEFNIESEKIPPLEEREADLVNIDSKHFRKIRAPYAPFLRTQELELQLNRYLCSWFVCYKVLIE